MLNAYATSQPALIFSRMSPVDGVEHCCQRVRFGIGDASFNMNIASFLPLNEGQVVRQAGRYLGGKTRSHWYQAYSQRYSSP